MTPLHALVFFTSYINDRGQRCWPKTPQEVIEHGCTLCSCIPYEVNYALKSEAKELYECWVPDTPLDLENLVYECMQNLAADGIEIIYSVHPKSVLLPLYKWYMMRPSDADKARMSYEMNALASRTRDLCEAFHAPAILSLEERSAFGPDVVTKWLDIRGQDDKNILKELWRRLP